MIGVGIYNAGKCLSVGEARSIFNNQHGLFLMRCAARQQQRYWLAWYVKVAATGVCAVKVQTSIALLDCVLLYSITASTGPMLTVV